MSSWVVNCSSSADVFGVEEPDIMALFSSIEASCAMQKRWEGTSDGVEKTTGMLC